MIALAWSLRTEHRKKCGVNENAIIRDWTSHAICVALDLTVSNVVHPSLASLVDGYPARSYAWSINRTTRAQSCTLIGGAAPRRQWSSASRSAVKAGAVTVAPGRV